MLDGSSTFKFVRGDFRECFMKHAPKRFLAFLSRLHTSEQVLSSIAAKVAFEIFCKHENVHCVTFRALL